MDKYMKIKIIKKFLLLTVFASSLFFTINTANPQKTNAAAFTCEPGFYQVMTGSFKKLDPDTGSYTVIGSTALNLNAVGYNIEDNYIYGLNNDPGNVTLIKVENDGTYTDLGAVAGLPSSSVLGDFDHSGNLYVATDNTTIYKIDISTVTATVINLSASIAGANDLVYINGHLYGTNGTTLYDITISDGNVDSKPLGLESATYGAGWATVDNRLYFSQNSNGIIYQVTNYDTNTPTYTAALQGDSNLIGNDGASCSMAATVIIEINAQDDTASTSFNQQLSVPAEDGLLLNDSPDNVTVTSFTQPTNGTVNVNSDGSYTYTPNTGFAGTDSFTYTITDSVGNTDTATVTITVAPGIPSAGNIRSSKIMNIIITSSIFIFVLIAFGAKLKQSFNTRKFKTAHKF